MTLSFFVQGIPKPAGSKRAFAIRKNGVFTGRIAVSDDCATSKDWKVDVSHAASKAMAESPTITGPVSVSFVFYVSRPKGHFGTGKNAQCVKESAPNYPTVKPDLLKLARGVEDAMTGIVWKDDAQIVEETISKVYTLDRTGCIATVKELINEAF